MRKNVLMQFVGFVFLICLWEGITRFFNVPEYIFPRFSVLILEFMKYPSYFLDGFLDLVENMTVYASGKDKALGMAKWQLGHRRLGEFKQLNLRPEMEDYLETHDTLMVVNATDARNARVDQGHGYFLRSPWVNTDVLVTFKFGANPAERGLVREEGSFFWRFSSDYERRINEIIRRRQTDGIKP